jgi:uncharacterized membrane protein YeiH
MKALFDLAGVAVFAMSGALAAGRKRLDLFGVFVVAVVTALGGGTLRDILLGRSPVFWVRDSIHVPVVIGASAFTILYTRFRVPPLRLLLIADAFGLAIFSISGAKIAEAAGASWIVVILMGAITGAAGGMIRDALCGEIPLILRGRQLYASAALGGTFLFSLVHGLGGPPTLAAGIGFLAVVTLRLASIFFGIELPVYDLADPSDGRTNRTRGRSDG